MGKEGSNPLSPVRVGGRRTHRGPLILDRAHFAAWLDPLTPAPALHELLRPCPPERIATHPVGPLVGNVKNDGPELVALAADLFTVCSAL
jgi:putative SOS response-associated peptidase YedK